MSREAPAVLSNYELWNFAQARTEEAGEEGGPESSSESGRMYEFEDIGSYHGPTN